MRVSPTESPAGLSVIKRLGWFCQYILYAAMKNLFLGSRQSEVVDPVSGKIKSADINDATVFFDEILQLRFKRIPLFVRWAKIFHR